MANNIFQQGITPIKPQSLAKERVFVYVEEATNNTKGIASFGQDDFIVNNGHVVLNTASLSRTPFDKHSLIKLDKNDFVLTEDLITQVNWPYAHLNGHENTNRAGLIKIDTDSKGYLKFTDDENHFLEVDIDAITNNLLLNINDRFNAVEADIENLNLEISGLNTDIDDIELNIATINNNLNSKLDKQVTSGTKTITFSNNGNSAQINANDSTNSSKISVSPDYNSGIILMSSPLSVSADKGINSLVRINGASIYQNIYNRATKESTTTTIRPTEVEIMVDGVDNTSIVLLTSDSFTYNGDDIVTKTYIDNKVNDINAVMIRNMEPDIVINATLNNVQTIATEYMQSHYNREPITNDGLYITLTDKNNDVVKFAYYNGSWVNIGLNDVDLSNYVDLTSAQDIGGNKNFTGNVTVNNIRVATENDVLNLTNKIDTNISKRLLIGADGVIEGSNIVFTVLDSESFTDYLTNQRVFSTSLYLPVVGTLDDNLTIRIEFGDTIYNVYSFMAGGNVPLTIGELKSVMSYNADTGYSFYPNLLFIRNNDITGFVIDPATILNSQFLDIKNYVDEKIGDINIVLDNINGEVI